MAAGLVWDYESWDALSARQVTLARQTGALTALPIAFNTRAGVHLFAGEFAEAASVIAETAAVTSATGSSIAPYGAAALAALRGREADAAELITAGKKDVQRRGEGEGLSFVHWATAVLCNSLGGMKRRWPPRRRQARTHPRCGSGTGPWSSSSSRRPAAGSPGLAAAALSRLAETTGASGTDWALGVEARSRALVSNGDAAEARYREAISRLGRTRLRVELGRAHLLLRRVAAPSPAHP